MARRFKTRNGRIQGRLDDGEAALLRELVEDVVRLVRSDEKNDVTARLFPDASPDPETAAAVKELIHDDLREAKLEAARALLGSLTDDGRLDLDAETAEQWLTALNDVRLAIGTAIGVTEDDHDADTGDDAMHLYHWLTFLQDSLVEAVSANVER
jgi:hypothetical protein